MEFRITRASDGRPCHSSCTKGKGARDSPIPGWMDVCRACKRRAWVRDEGASRVLMCCVCYFWVRGRCGVANGGGAVNRWVRACAGGAAFYARRWILEIVETGLGGWVGWRVGVRGGVMPTTRLQRPFASRVLSMRGRASIWTNGCRVVVV